MNQKKQSPIDDGFLSNIVSGIEHLNPSEIWLFGSVVEMGQDASDVDLFVLSQEFKDVHFRSRRHMLNLPNSVVFDVWLYTPAEFESLFSNDSYFRQSMSQTRLDVLSYLEEE